MRQELNAVEITPSHFSLLVKNGIALMPPHWEYGRVLSHRPTACPIYFLLPEDIELKKGGTQLELWPLLLYKGASVLMSHFPSLAPAALLHSLPFVQNQHAKEESLADDLFRYNPNIKRRR
ncbi:Nibrin [Camelus dromedarius]|uniref:Nibrin n=1 Tax=Camelus dromedarius TaxID=9838 RepID=A0A5N4CCJ6_CAMDR|nr:Nibrin [Camelus dromedarius]